MLCRFKYTLNMFPYGNDILRFDSQISDKIHLYLTSCLGFGDSLIFFKEFPLCRACCYSNAPIVAFVLAQVGVQNGG